ncbi:hypothetical protein ACLOJK_012569 [Asimina triloba]
MEGLSANFLTYDIHPRSNAPHLARRIRWLQVANAHGAIGGEQKTSAKCIFVPSALGQVCVWVFTLRCKAKLDESVHVWHLSVLAPFMQIPNCRRSLQQEPTITHERIAQNKKKTANVLHEIESVHHRCPI